MIKIGDIVRGEAGFLDVVLGIVTGCWEDDPSKLLVLWLGGVYEGETFTEHAEDLEFVA